MKHILVLLLTSLSLTNCAAVEIDISSMEVERLNRNGLSKIVGEDSTLPLVDQWTEGSLLLVQIVTESNLLELLKEKHANIRYDSYMCGKRDVPIILGLPDLYFDGQSLMGLKISGASIQKNYSELGVSKYKYDAILFTSWSKDRALPSSLVNDSKQKIYMKYDLINAPESLCMMLGGTNYIEEIHSKELVLPKEKLIEILSQ